MRFGCFIVRLGAKLQILFELWRVLTGNVADTAKIISMHRFRCILDYSQFCSRYEDII